MKCKNCKYYEPIITGQIHNDHNFNCGKCTNYNFIDCPGIIYGNELYITRRFVLRSVKSDDILHNDNHIRVEVGENFGCIHFKEKS